MKGGGEHGGKAEKNTVRHTERACFLSRYACLRLEWSKYSSFPAAAEFRARAAEALAGAPGMEEALGVFGGRTEKRRGGQR